MIGSLFYPLVGIGVCCALLHVARKEWDRPATWSSAFAAFRRYMPPALVTMAGSWGCISLLLLGLAGSMLDAGNARADFETGLVQALEAASGGHATPRETRGLLATGSRYDLVVDEAGPVVRIIGASQDLCTRVLSDLSPYARSALRAQAGSGEWLPVDQPGRACGGGASPVGLSLRPAAWRAPGPPGVAAPLSTGESAAVQGAP